MNYSVTETAKMLDISTKTVYRYIEKMKHSAVDGFIVNVNGDVNGDVNGQFRCKYLITDIGIDYIRTDRNIPKTEQSNNNDNELINSLLEQIKAKDRQIEMLLRQTENYQLLLGQELIQPNYMLSSTDATLTDNEFSKTKHINRLKKLFRKPKK